jgi:hypothetical protein
MIASSQLRTISGLPATNVPRINRAGLVLWVPASAESDRSLRA